ncbi:RING finger protein PFF0165c-like [Drosophila innubila]|uniref:RING finger protein PFF0165c-like n=1 Tax=Drosophila innubila TaxID=198719 RepID=UPI00148CFB42|nr:RING finger protein PFF0165c-like [Drosophila innubila]
MAEIAEAMENNNEEGMLDEIEDGVSSSEDEADEDEENTPDVLTLESTSLIQQVKELTSSIEKLVVQIKRQNSDDNSIYDLHQLWLDQAANLKDIQYKQVEEFQKHLLQNYQMRQKLLTDLKNHDKAYLVELGKLKQHCKIEIENLTTLQNSMQTDDFQKKILEKCEERQKLLADIKKRDDTHLIQIENLKPQYKKNVDYVKTLQNKQADEFKKQILEINQMRQQAKEKEELIKQLLEDSNICSICLHPWNQTDSHYVVSLKCGHLFGNNCIYNYILAQKMCPMCRAFASSDDRRPVYGVLTCLTQSN